MVHLNSKLVLGLSILAIISGMSCLGIKQSSPAIASYNHYITPTYKITRYYDPRYKYRFHPNNNLYIHSRVARTRITIYRHYRNKRHALIEHKMSQIESKQHYNAQILATRIPIYDAGKLRNVSAIARLKLRIASHHLRMQHHQARHHLLCLNNELAKLRYRLKYTPVQSTAKSFKWRKIALRLNDKYRIQPVHNHNIMYLNANYPIWRRPYHPGVKWTTATNRLAKDTQAIKIRARAESHGHVFYLISSTGYKYGWVPKQALVKAHIYQLPFHYYSQLYPVKAPDACEAVALRMALSTKGHDPNISMRRFIDNIPRSKNPELGYTANPYKYGDEASIYPRALAKYGRQYDSHVHAVHHLTEHKLISNLEQGNPIVYEGAYRMNTPGSDHTLVLIGYSDNSLEFADPYYTGTSSESKPISWVSISKFEDMFHCKLRGSRAVVVR